MKFAPKRNILNRQVISPRGRGPWAPPGAYPPSANSGVGARARLASPIPGSSCFPLINCPGCGEPPATGATASQAQDAPPTTQGQEVAVLVSTGTTWKRPPLRMVSAPTGGGISRTWWKEPGSDVQWSAEPLQKQRGTAQSAFIAQLRRQGSDQYLVSSSSSIY